MKDIVELIDMEVTEDDLRHGVEDEYGVLYSEDGLYLMECHNRDLRSYTVKDGCMVICEKAFFNRSMPFLCELEEIVIPEGIVAIGGAAFMFCTELRSVRLPESLRYIGEGAFELCSSLKHLTLPSGLTAMGGNPLVDSGVMQIHSRSPRFSVTSGYLMQGDKMVAWISHKSRCVVLEGTRKLGDEAFPSERNTHEVILPESLEEIGSNAFQGCDLQRLTIPQDVRKMGDNPFANCQVKVLDIRSPHFSFSDGFLISDKGVLVAYLGASADVTVPDTVTEIGAGAFYGKDGVRSIVLPCRMATIRHNAFANCEELTSISIPDTVTRIEEGAFLGCKRLRSAALPHGLTLVNDRLFSLSGVEEITIPEGVTHIGKEAFSHCERLHTVRIPDSVKSIGKYAFTACGELKEIVIPDDASLHLGAGTRERYLRRRLAIGKPIADRNTPMKYTTSKIKYFYPSGRPLPNGSHFQRGGFLHECRVNKDAFTLQFPHLEGPVGLGAQGGVIVFPEGAELPDFPKETPIIPEKIQDYSVGHAFHGSHVDSYSQKFGVESLTVEVDGTFTETVFELAKHFAQKYHLESLIVKDISEDTVYLVTNNKSWINQGNYLRQKK